jgi:glycosyltransferase involved in cell wall biosynthesis
VSLVDGVSVIVVGDGPESPALRAAFPNVRFAGHVPRPTARAFIAAANVLVSASRDEGAPSVVREARALGVPVVALAAGDMSEWAKSDPGLFVVE